MSDQSTKGRVHNSRMGSDGARHRLGWTGLSAAALILGAQALAPALRADDQPAQPARAVRLSNVEGGV
jgi:hypothetical protein